MNQMEQFKQTFFGECAELLIVAEENLSEIENGSYDSETVNAVFRAVHSIKAGAGAFQMKALVEFTHVFESVLDCVRNDEIELTPATVKLSIRSVDVLAELINGAAEGTPVDSEFTDSVLKELEQLLGESSDAAAAPPPPSAPVGSGESGSGGSAFQIAFKPKRTLYLHANEPLLILRELERLGPCEIVLDASKLPDLLAVDPHQSYFSWLIRVETDKGREAVEEAFEFVLDDCELEITEAAAPAAEEATEEEAQEEEPAEAEESPAAAAASPTTQAAPNAGAANNRQQNVNRITSIRVSLDRVDRLVDMVGELVIAQSMVLQNISRQAVVDDLDQLRGLEDLTQRTRTLQEGVMAIRMQPVKSVFARMPRIVRDLSAKLGKEARLTMRGEQTEVDKTVVEELADPLTHMVRNSIDHGLEMPEAREAAGKPVAGEIELSAEHRGGRIVIAIRDDGRGIDAEKIKERAVEKGVITSDTARAMSRAEAFQLIFAPGFSTAEVVSDVSGRGVGMDVVRRNIQSLGGRISIESEEGKGSKFILTLPLTLAVLDGMLVSVGEERFIVPITSIVETVRPEPSDIRNLPKEGRILSARGEFISLVFVNQAFGIPAAQVDPTQGLVIVVETEAGRKLGVVVDELIGQQQVVIKNLEENYRAIEGVSGATILGDGRVALILDPDGLTHCGAPLPSDDPSPEDDEEKTEEEATQSEQKDEDSDSAESAPDTDSQSEKEAA